MSPTFECSICVSRTHVRAPTAGSRQQSVKHKLFPLRRALLGLRCMADKLAELQYLSLVNKVTTGVHAIV